MYGNGQGVAQDYVRAHMWFNLAIAQGITENAAKNRDIMAEKMTPAQVDLRQTEDHHQCVNHVPEHPSTWSPV